LQRFPTPDHLAAATVEEVEQVIYPLGLRWRAPLLQNLGVKLAELNGVIPADLDAIMALPGVGQYAAAAWLSFLGGGHSVLIDANIVRWIGRLVDQPVDGETRRKKWLIELATRLTPETDVRAYNYAVLDFTMAICAKQPLCDRCPIMAAGLCAYGRSRAES
jgi:A/G-specific adenine glycosylase